jgi:four helix bundle protein
MQDHRQLEIWQRAMTYAVAIYKWSILLPPEERYNLADQMRRASSSVPLNIAEGAACDSNIEFARFLGYAYRSLKEVVTCLELSERLHQSLPEPASTLIDEGDQLARMTRALILRLRERRSVTAVTRTQH